MGGRGERRGKPQTQLDASRPPGIEIYGRTIGEQTADGRTNRRLTGDGHAAAAAGGRRAARGGHATAAKSSEGEWRRRRARGGGAGERRRPGFRMIVAWSGRQGQLGDRCRQSAGQPRDG